MRTILLVESDGAVREPLAMALRTAGYAVMAVGTATEATRFLCRAPPDAVILDPDLPDMAGVLWLGRVRRTAGLEAVPVVILAASAARQAVIAAARLGVRSYVLRSRFSLSDMVQRLEAEWGGGKRPEPAPSASPARPAPRREKDSGPTPPPAAPAVPDHAQALRSLQPIVTRDELLSLVKAGGELKAFSPTVGMVIHLTGDPNCSVDAVAKAISQDHGVAVKILKLANSVAFTRGEPADSVRKAVVRIGLGKIRQTVLNIGVVERFSAPAFADELSTAAFWEHAIGCAVVAAGLAKIESEDLADRAFTAGLLHDVGRVILAEQLGERYVRVIRTARELRLPLEQVESRMLQMNHADVLEPVLRAWNCRDLIQPLACHHLSLGTARVSDPDLRREVARLALANRLAHALMLGSSGNETVYPTHELCRELGLDGAAVRRITSEARRHTDDMKFTLLARSNSAPWPDHAGRFREALRVPFRPLYLGANAATDAHAILCGELADPPGEGGEGSAPTLAVLHAGTPQEGRSMLEQLRAAESVHGAMLPILALTPGAKEHLDPELLAGRRAATLPTPLAVARLIETINWLLGAAKQAA